MVIKSVVVWTVVLVGLVESDLTIPVRMRQLTPRLENTIRDVIVHEAIEKKLERSQLVDKKRPQGICMRTLNELNALVPDHRRRLTNPNGH